MSVGTPNIKKWHMDGTAYVSPRFPDTKVYLRYKKFFVRQNIQIEGNDAMRIIRVPITEKAAPGNYKKLRALGMV